MKGSIEHRNLVCVTCLIITLEMDKWSSAIKVDTEFIILNTVYTFLVHSSRVNGYTYIFIIINLNIIENFILFFINSKNKRPIM